MKKLTLSFILFVSLAFANNDRKPPQEAIDICLNKKSNSQCIMNRSGSNDQGRCEYTPNKEYFACKPSQDEQKRDSRPKEQKVNTSKGGFKLEVWADNWFAAYLDEKLIVEDSISIITERSFNSETKYFDGNYPLNLNFIIKDFKQNDTGLEYIGSRKQQMGDGGFIMQVTDTHSKKVIAVSNENMTCQVIHKAPLDKRCANSINPIAGEGLCRYEKIDEPIGWKKKSFDTSSWQNAKVYREEEVRPKHGYDDIAWNENAKLIWGDDLEQDNTLLCKVTIEGNTQSKTSKNKRCKQISDSVHNAGFNDVGVTCDEEYAYLSSDTYPNHDKMNGITGTNEQVPIPAVNYASPILLNPKGTTGTTTIDASVGVAINGVPIYDYSSQGNLDVNTYSKSIDTFVLGQLDNCGGHAGRGDDYHYHKRPNCMIDDIEEFKDDTIIGWGYDGYPIYDLKNPDGSKIAEGELDVCNGKVDEIFGYRYHTSLKAPYITQCLRGKVDTTILPRVPPFQGKTTGRPPRDGVENLKFTQKDGLVRMDYTHEGQKYYIQYKPSSSENCYLFETKTVTNAGKIISGEFCR